MLTRSPRRGALLFAVLSTSLAMFAAPVSGPAVAAPEPIRLNPSTLPQGAPPAIPYFDPYTKRLYDGSKRLNLTTLQGTVEQVHKVDGGYLLGRSTSPGADLVFVSTGGKRTLITQQWRPPRCDCLRSDVMVDSGGGSVTFNRTTSSGSYKDTVTVSLPALRIIRTRSFSSLPRLFEQRRGRVLLGLVDRLVRWAPGTNRTAEVAAGGAGFEAADSTARQLVARADDGGGAQSVEPLPPATGASWALDADENISAWSADDLYVAGSFEIKTDGTDDGFIVRRASDGDATLVVYIPARARITWENNTTVLFPTWYEYGDFQMVRCTIAGDCERVGPASKYHAYVVATRRSN